MEENKILYEEKTSKIWFWAVLILSVIIVAFFYSGIGPTAFLIPLPFILAAFLFMFGSSFKMHEKSMIIKIFFSNNEVVYDNIDRMEKGTGWIFQIGHMQAQRTRVRVKTEKGEILKPDFFWAVSVSPFKKGILFYMKNREKIFVRFKDADKVFAIIQGRKA